MTTNQKSSRIMTTDKNSEGVELLPCPFCGSEARISGPEWVIECNRVGVCNGQARNGFLYREDAVNYWNRRASIPTAEVLALVERMDRELMCGAPVISTTGYWRDELVKIARDYAPEVSEKPPSPRKP